MTREPAECCGENWARCGELVATAGRSRLRSASLVRKTVSMEALEKHARAITRASVEIRTPVQSFAAHARATRSNGDAPFDMKSDSAEST
jgi:hypothetical protein